MIGLAQSDDRIELFRFDMDFHWAIVAATHNPPLRETHDRYNARLWRARFISSQRCATRETQMRKHQNNVDALLARDGKTAATALRNHLSTAVGNIEAALKERSAKRHGVRWSVLRGEKPCKAALGDSRRSTIRA